MWRAFEVKVVADDEPVVYKKDYGTIVSNRLCRAGKHNVNRYVKICNPNKKLHIF